MTEYCKNCAARFVCSLEVEYGSVACLVKRMQRGQTKGDFLNNPQADCNEARYCRCCGTPLRIIGTERFCNNLLCAQRYKSQ